MIKVNTVFGDDFYIGADSNGYPLYNIVPEGSDVPQGGYSDKEYIAKVKNADVNEFNIYSNKFRISEEEDNYEISFEKSRLILDINNRIKSVLKELKITENLYQDNKIPHNSYKSSLIRNIPVYNWLLKIKDKIN